MMSADFRGRRFLVTGGSSGIGLAVVTGIVEAGGTVHVVGRSRERLSDVENTLGKERVLPIRADLASESALDRIADEVLSAGPLDGVLVSTGGPPVKQAIHATREEWMEAFEGTFLPPVQLTNKLAPSMSMPAAIGWVLSSSVKGPLDNLALSGGLRPGLALLIKQFADEFGARGPRMFGLAPGRIRTSRTAQVDGGPGSAREASIERIPAGRLGEPNEIADVAMFLLSSNASYVTGSTVMVDGGYSRNY